MSNKNILLMLHEELSRCTAQKIYPTDLADLLGYGTTQIKAYFRAAKAGEIENPNARLERSAFLAFRVGQLEGFESLFPLIPKLSGDFDDSHWLKKIGMRVKNTNESDPTTNGQIDFIESETDDKEKLLECIKLDCKTYLSLPVQADYDSVAERVFKVCGELGIDTNPETKKAVCKFLEGWYQSDSAITLTNIRMVRKYMKESDCIVELIPVDFPDYVPVEMKDKLRGHDKSELREIIAYGSESAVIRCLEGLIK